jgi:hypothetical protein
LETFVPLKIANRGEQMLVEIGESVNFMV